jgi:hypothetical protein
MAKTTGTATATVNQGDHPWRRATGQTSRPMITTTIRADPHMVSQVACSDVSHARGVMTTAANGGYVKP